MKDEYFRKMFGEWIRTATHDGQADFQGGVALFKQIARDQVEECIKVIEITFPGGNLQIVKDGIIAAVRTTMPKQIDRG